ncbi:hypothetical protein CKAH01_08613 [Colletotrichum kahawae]|uniref:Uncharacterized protein n=1 Tax=Colletotrichum kahawae TaxID=34407 RepID=A0AAE0D0B4_COLKA|nr:hypothetical protein CKAH01_08613 [Colletotrichum kahawae]
MARLEDLSYELWVMIMKGLDPLSTIHFAKACPRGYAVLCGLLKRRYDEIARKIGHKNMGLIWAKDVTRDAFGRSHRLTRQGNPETHNECDERLQLAISRLRSCITGEVPRHGKGWLLPYLEDSKKLDDFNVLITGCNSFIKLVNWRLLALGMQPVPSALRKDFLVALVTLRVLSGAVFWLPNHSELTAQLAEEVGIWACEGFKYLVYAYPSRQAALMGVCGNILGIRHEYLPFEKYFCPSSSLMNSAGGPALNAN